MINSLFTDHDALIVWVAIIIPLCVIMLAQVINFTCYIHRKFVK